MGTVTYLTIGGEIVSETRNGVDSDYLPDSPGSTVALLNSSQSLTDTWTYWPFGQVQSRTGNNPTPFQFLGTRGGGGSPCDSKLPLAGIDCVEEKYWVCMVTKPGDAAGCLMQFERRAAKCDGGGGDE